MSTEPSSTFNSFSTNNGSFGPKEFLESNSLVAKFSFLLLVLLTFVLLLRVGVLLLTYYLKPTNSPHLIDGMVPANQQIIFPQDPISNGAVTIHRSDNADGGVEFTWSVWIFIDSIPNDSGTNDYKHVFSKGNSDISGNGMIEPNNAPGLYIIRNTNDDDNTKTFDSQTVDLLVVMNTFDSINEEINIPEIPMNKWVNVIIRCKNTTLDVYISGTIARSLNLPSVPKQNYGDVYVAMNGGFQGNISNLWYYNYALGVVAIQNLVNNGPNNIMINGGANGSMTSTLNNYLSLRWFN